jgi:hypothetical protein
MALFLSWCLGALVVNQSSTALLEYRPAQAPPFVFIWRIPPLFDLNSGEIAPVFPNAKENDWKPIPPLAGCVAILRELSYTER